MIDFSKTFKNVISSMPTLENFALPKTQTTSPNLALNALKQLYGGVKQIFPGVPKIVESIQQKSIQPYASYLKESAKLEITPQKSMELAMGFMPMGTAKKISTDPIKEYLSKNVSMEAKTAVSKGIKQKLSDIYTSVIDRFNPIVKLTRQAEKVIGEIPAGESPEILARRYLGIKGLSESKLFWKTFSVDSKGNLNITGEGLSKVLEPVKNNIDDLRALLIAERDIELAGRGIEAKKTLVDPDKIINILKQKYGDRFAELNNTALGVRDYARKAILNPLKEVGAISDDVYNKIVSSNQFYTPFKRVMEEIETQGHIPVGTNLFSPKTVPLKVIKGSERQIIDPLESLITDTYKVTDFVERERVAKSLVNLSRLSPDMAEIIKPISPKMIPVAQVKGKVVIRPSFFPPGKNTIQVFENGIRKFYQVPEDVAKAMNSLGSTGMGIVQKILSFPARTLRAGATLTPEFIGRNPIRDQFSAMVYSKYGYNPPIDFVSGVWSTIGKNDLYWKWQASGGAHSMFVSLDRISGQKTLQNVLGKGERTYNPLEALRALSEFGEKGTRIGVYKRVLQKGIPELKAGFESRDVTLDFSRIGSQTKAVNQIIAFFNANVQGLDKLIRSFKERPLQTAFKATAGITVPSISLYLINKDNPRYKELAQWQKDLFWIIIPPGEKSPIIRIPKPFELGIIFGTVPEHILAWIQKNESEQLTSIPGVLAKGASPGVIPTIMLPIIENQSNYSFFRDRPIVGQSIDNLPAEFQSNAYTSETAKEIGKLIKQSPAKIENLVQGYFAGMGQYALDTSDAILKGLGIVSPPPQPSKTLADIPFIKAFVAREPIGSGSESVNKFYEIFEKASQEKAAAKKLVEQGKNDEAIKYMREHKEIYFATGLNNLAQKFSDLREKEQDIYNARDISPEKKRKAIDALDKLMTEMARQTLELIKGSI